MSSGKAGMVGRTTDELERGHPAALDNIVSNLQYLNTGLCQALCGRGQALHVRYYRIANRTPVPSDRRPGNADTR